MHRAAIVKRTLPEAEKAGRFSLQALDSFDDLRQKDLARTTTELISPVASAAAPNQTLLCEVGEQPLQVLRRDPERLVQRGA